jgi:hypothetical protein
MLAGVGAAVAIAEHTVPGTPRFIGSDVHGTTLQQNVVQHIFRPSVTPWWLYAFAVVVGLLGLAIAVWIYRGDDARIAGGSLSPG